MEQQDYDFPPDKTVRLRGLPYQSSIEDVTKFFSDLSVGRVQFLMNQAGKPCGEAFVSFTKREDAQVAHSLTGKHIQDRYIEIFPVTERDVSNRLPQAAEQSRTVKLRGLPFEITKEAVREFFTGFDVEDVHLIERETGSADAHRKQLTGEAFVRFSNSAMAVRSHEKHKEKIGTRWIEVFRASDYQMDCALDPTLPPPKPDVGTSNNGRPNWDHGPSNGSAPRGPGPWNGPPMNQQWNGPPQGQWGPGPWGPPPFPGAQWQPGPPGPWGPPPPWAMGPGPCGPPGLWGPPQNGGPPSAGNKRPMDSLQPTAVKMRGLPWKTSKEDIERFFLPLVPCDVDILHNDDGRPSGTARISFDTADDARAAMKKNKDYIGERYVELHMDGVGTSTAKRAKMDDIPIPIVASGEANGYEKHIQSYAAFKSQQAGPETTATPYGEYPQNQQSYPYQQQYPPYQHYPQQQYQPQPHQAYQQATAAYSSQSNEEPKPNVWKSYEQEYDEYLRKYNEYARTMEAKGMKVPPPEKRADPLPSAPPAPPPPPAAPTSY